MGRNRNPYQLHLVSPRAILFLVYIYDLPDEVHSRVRLFADDTALYFTMENEDDSSALQTDLDILSAWETRWDMEFNSSKCQVVHVTGSRKTVKTDYVLHEQVLECVPCAMWYLGVDISSGLTWNSHIDCVTAKANRTLWFIQRNIKTNMPKVRVGSLHRHSEPESPTHLGSPSRK